MGEYQGLWPPKPSVASTIVWRLRPVGRIASIVPFLSDTSSRSEKVAILAGLLRRRDSSEVAVGFLAGGFRQGRVGIGYSTIYGVERAPARQAALTVDDLDRAVAEVQGTTGSGSAAKRKRILAELLGRATAEEADFVHTPLDERSARLEGIAPHLKIPGVITSDPEAAQRVLDRALQASHEGVVVKAAASHYSAGRRGKAWRKVKPVRTYDLVVFGAEWGHGRRRGRLSNLHLGARDPSTGEFVMVGKCFKGLTDELLDWQTGELLARESGRDGIAVLVRSELVVEIALDGVQSSTRYPGGVALRLARVKRYRPDKSAAEADTIDDLRALLTSRP